MYFYKLTKMVVKYKDNYLYCMPKNFQFEYYDTSTACFTWQLSVIVIIRCNHRYKWIKHSRNQYAFYFSVSPTSCWMTMLIKQLNNYEPVIPAAVPQLGGTHHADEKTLSRTPGNSVICRWTCSKFSTKANIAPMMNRTKPRTNNVVNFIDIAAPK